MSSEDFAYLQDWYASHCDGDWEHAYGVRITTLDNPGWRLEVDLADTELSGRLIPRTINEFSDEVWVEYRSDGAAFDAACGPRGLALGLAAFREMSGE